ncbi:DUF4817 domain-containing protein [Trichonephila clavipes]|nr:DUF4817 domain-containing protein [Trichonephila clavipes]
MGDITQLVDHTNGGVMYDYLIEFEALQHLKEEVDYYRADFPAKKIFFSGSVGPSSIVSPELNRNAIRMRTYFLLIIILGEGIGRLSSLSWGIHASLFVLFLFSSFENWFFHGKLTDLFSNGRNNVRSSLLVEWLRQQTNRIWSEANPQVYVETPLHPEKLTVWCALWDGGIIGPYFFKNDEGHNVTVNGDRYRAMITNFFIPELNNHDVQELWFQQDGATCHTARATIDLLKYTLGDCLISRFGPVN